MTAGAAAKAAATHAVAMHAGGWGGRSPVRGRAGRMAMVMAPAPAAAAMAGFSGVVVDAGGSASSLGGGGYERWKALSGRGGDALSELWAPRISGCLANWGINGVWATTLNLGGKLVPEAQRMGSRAWVGRSCRLEVVDEFDR
jgi:hypothetical protein